MGVGTGRGTGIGDLSLQGLKISTLNVNSLYKDRNISNLHLSHLLNMNRADKALSLKQSFADEVLNSSISILTDTRTTVEDVRDLKKQFFRSHVIYSTISHRKRGGVTIFVKRDIDHSLVVQKEFYGSGTEGGRTLFLQLKLVNNTLLNIAGSYICPENLDKSIRENCNFLQACLLRHKSKFIILAGDFNISLDSENKQSYFLKKVLN